ncbi:hypothetical protein B0H10DRAFT_1823065 [Mycena sp. CBHHK59/15]|nr:hypothetical protein B0H10DRAFT_1823065 [Mycena sp. CBHHK59/15]
MCVSALDFFPSVLTLYSDLRLSIYATTLLLIDSVVASVNFTQCFQDVKSNWISFNDTTGATDSHGNPVSDLSLATGITYALCVEACGTGGGPFSWSQFSQQLSAWLLPWVALFFQFPFGSRFKYDNLMSVVLALGSPCLAAYSLSLTVLNKRWIARRFANIQYPNSGRAALVLSSLQYAPLTVNIDGNLLASLVVLPENDKWWRELAEWLDYADIHTWTLAGIASMIWVVLAYILTIIDAFNAISTDPNGNGQGLSGIGSIWLWTIPVCLGYLQLSPRCDTKRLENALNRANKVAHVAGTDGVIRASTLNARHALSFEFCRKDELYRDQEATAPIYNYARFLSFVQVAEEVASAFRSAADYAMHHRPVNPDLAWQHGHPCDDEIHPANRTGSVADKVSAYCRAQRSHWGPDVFSRIFIASLAALGLQWATSGASIVIVYFTQAERLGCRSGAYLFYASVATFVWILFLASSILCHYVTASVRIHDISHHVVARIALFLRYLAKFLATCNAVWIIAAFIMQFSDLYDRCYCDSNVLSQGKRAHSVMVLTASDISVMKVAWIGGFLLAVVSSGLFIGFITICIDSPLDPL